MLAIALLLAAAPNQARIDVYLVESEKLSASDALLLTDGLSKAIERQSGLRAGTQAGLPCGMDEARCIQDVLRQSSVTAVVVLRAFAGPVRVAVSAEAHRSGRKPDRLDAFLPKASDTWAPELEKLARGLFPSALSSSTVVVDVAPPPEEVVIAPWILLGASALLVATGAGFGISSYQARSKLSQGPLGFDEFQPLDDRATNHRLVALILIGVGAAVGITGTTWLLTD